MIFVFGTPPDQAELHPRIADRLREWTESRPRAMINATGVIIHTNLGRAPLSAEAIEAMTLAAAGSPISNTISIEASAVRAWRQWRSC